MKIRRIIMAAILSFAITAPAVVRADDVPAAGSTAGLLAIDNQNVYAGMDKSYAAGYMPTESGGAVRVVLPLTASAAVQGDAITVTPGLGTPESSPFVFGNYVVTVKLASQNINGGAAAVPAFLLDLTLPLSSDRLQGTYPLTLSVSYKDGSGTDMQQTFSLYVTVDGKAPPTQAPVSTPEPPRHQPKVLVSHYSVNPDPVVAGEDFTLFFTLENTSASYTVSNIQVTIKSDTTDFYPADNADTLYFKSLGKGKSLDVSFPMKTKEDATTDPHNINVSISYEDDKATSFAQSADIPITVTQSLRLEFDTPNVPASMTAGDTAPFTLQVMNKGRSKVYNVMCMLQAPGLLPQASAFLGNIDPGTAVPAQIMVFAGSLDMTGDGSAASPGGASGFGKTKGTITVTYEDEFGKQYTGTVDISTTVNAPVIAASAPTEAPQPKASQWWISALIAAVLIAAVAVLLLLSRRNRERKVRAHDEG